MIKPNMPNIPGIGTMTETLDFVKNLWGNMGLPGVNLPNMTIPGMNIPGMGGGGLNIPGMVMPTLSVEEINKKISDLKAVESWLALNMSMLRGTIQALEVQAATISTLKSMGESFTNTIKPTVRAKQDEAPPAPSSGNNGAKADGNDAGDDSPAPARRAKAPPPEPTSKDEQDAANLTAPLVNAAAWWNMLQDQFKQAVGTAMASENTGDKAPAEKRAAKPKARTASSSSSASSASSTAARKRKTTK